MSSEISCDAPSLRESPALSLKRALERIGRLEAALLYIAETDHHYRTPPRPKSDGGLRGWAGHHAVWALTGQNGSFVCDDKVRAALVSARKDGSSQQPASLATGEQA